MLKPELVSNKPLKRVFAKKSKMSKIVVTDSMQKISASLQRLAALLMKKRDKR
jgi:hypothetical protein